MHHSPKTSPTLDQTVATKQTQQRLGRAMLFRRRRLGRQALTVEPLQQVVGRQGDLHQTDQRLDTLGRLEEHGTDRQRRLPLVMSQFHIILLLELREQRVAAVLAWGGGEQRRQAIVGRRRGRRGVVALPAEAIAGLATTSRGGW